jgi:DNA polymerase-3 subunit gamma/tau
LTNLFGDPEVETPAAAVPETGIAYRVLARKYRPQNFAELIGQDSLVRTLTNAFKTNRIAHAFMLTGVRGIGKTTTARIIAKGLNCIGADGAGGPTVEPCGVCANCVAIAADRHVDVIEMDAASHNGVDDIREVTDGARYAPALGRYKVYIVDEVHMLSKQAFNALLKTLEEPPPHVKFILATTEIRKVPVTILSRCQRFDLRRVESEILKAHFTRIVEKEGAAASAEALALIARAADGSVRDGLSLLDQAIARAEGQALQAETVRLMLGLADRIVIFDLLEAVLKGEAAAALQLLAELHQAGADPATIAEDLLELVHHLTRAKLVPAVVDDPTIPEAERVKGALLAAAATMPVLTRTWTILLKGLAEINAAPLPAQALEMVVLRLCFTADLPSPGELIRQLQNAPAGQPASTSPATPRGGGSSMGGGVTAVAAAPLPQEDYATHPLPTSFRGVVALFAAEREMLLSGQLRSAVHLVRFEPGLIEFRLEPNAPQSLPATVAKKLTEWTGKRWTVSIAPNAEGEPTLAEQDNQNRSQALIDAAAHPTIKALLLAFPGATLTGIETVEEKTVEVEAAPDDETWLDE